MMIILITYKKLLKNFILRFLNKLKRILENAEILMHLSYKSIFNFFSSTLKIIQNFFIQFFGF